MKFLDRSGLSYLYNKIKNLIKSNIHIGADTPPDDSQLWIDSNEIATFGSEVVDSLEGNEFNKAPSVAAIKRELENYSPDGSKIIHIGPEEPTDKSVVLWIYTE